MCYAKNTQRTIIDENNNVTVRFKDALQFAVEYDLTRYDGTKAYRPTDRMTRQEAARVFSEYAIRVLCRTPHKVYANSFTDLGTEDSTLTDYIKLSYEL